MKPFYLLLLSLSLLQYASAQTVAKKQILAGESGDDEALPGIIRTRDGGFLAGAFSTSLPGTNKRAPNYGSYDYWIIKYDRSGKKQFDKTYGTTDYDALYTFIQTSDGGYALGGTADSMVSGTKTAPGKGGGDMWLVKTDSLGNQLWDKAYGGSIDENLNCVSQTRDGGYILAGTSSSNISGDKTENSFGGFDYWVVKIDAAGNLQWSRTFGGTGYDVATNVAQTADGGYFIAGHSTSARNGNKTSNTRGGEDIWIVKTDSLGNKLWDRNIGGNTYDELVTMQPAPDGGFVLGAWSESNISGDKTEATKGYIDYWIVKVNGAGVIQWQKDIGSNDADYLSAVKLTSDGGYILAGYSNANISGDKTENHRGLGFDGWVVKLSADRTVEWDKTVGGENEDQPGTNGIVEISPNQYLLSATSNSPAGFDKTVPNRGNFDVWLTAIAYNPLAFGNKVAVAPLASLPASSSFAVLPNPVRDVMHVQVGDKATVTLSGPDGKPVLTKMINGRADIRVSLLAAGTYYLKNAATAEVKKVVIVK